MQGKTLHISIIKSEVVSAIGFDKVKAFVEQFSVPNDLSVYQIRHTISLDWANFSICSTLGIKSAKLDAFPDAFQKEFGIRIKVSPHITIATRSRC
jgi:hypothetical protein